MVEIRQLTSQDAQGFFELRMSGLRLVPTAFGGSYEDEVVEGIGRIEAMITRQNVGNAIFGAFINDEIVGSIGIFQESGRKLAHKAIIWGMFVKPEKQKQGIGKKLVLVALDQAHQMNGIVTVNLSVESSNLSAKSLYESCGFETWGKEPQALKVNGKFYSEDHMIHYLNGSIFLVT